MPRVRAVAAVSVFCRTCGAWVPIVTNGYLDRGRIYPHRDRAHAGDKMCHDRHDYSAALVARTEPVPPPSRP